MAKEFKPGQKVVIKSIMINDLLRRDFPGYFVKKMNGGPKRGQLMISINDTNVFLKEDMVEDFEGFYKNKGGKND